MKIFGSTDIGKRRRKNEDCFAVKEYGGVSLVVVCDGMGGANGGTVASSVAVEQFTESVDAAFRRGTKLLTEGDCASLLAHAAAAILLLLLSRLLFRVYSQVWRYGDMRPYAFLIFAEKPGLGS